MLLAMARDVRVILIAGRPAAQHAHDGARGRRQAPVAHRRETLDIYAPIAHRLGLNQTYRELQGAVVPAPAAVAPRGAGPGGAARAQPPRRRERIQRDVEKAFADAR